MLCLFSSLLYYISLLSGCGNLITNNFKDDGHDDVEDDDNVDFEDDDHDDADCCRALNPSHGIWVPWVAMLDNLTA